MSECPAAKMIMVTRFVLLVLTIIVPLNGMTVINSGPPPHSKVAQMARYIIHNSDWVSVATVSQIREIKTYPFANLKSMSDGPVSNGTGVPYFYMSPMDFTGIDVEADNRCTILASLAESNYCKQESFDPQDPRCARIIMSGHLVQVNDNNENEFAKNALFTRHPSMKNWPIDHNWYIAKIDIQMIAVLDYFGGAEYVSKEDYFNASVGQSILENLLFENVKVIEVIV